MDTQDDSLFGHDEAYIIMIYVLQAANHGKSIICVLSDERHVCPTGVLDVSGGAAVKDANGAM